MRREHPAPRRRRRAEAEYHVGGEDVYCHIAVQLVRCPNEFLNDLNLYCLLTDPYTIKAAVINRDDAR